MFGAKRFGKLYVEHKGHGERLFGFSGERAVLVYFTLPGNKDLLAFRQTRSHREAKQRELAQKETASKTGGDSRPEEAVFEGLTVAASL